MALKAYASQPDEATELVPDILEALKNKGYLCYEKSLFDIYVINRMGRGMHVEVKVRLETQKGSFPVTRKQWILINSVQKDSPLNLNTKIVVYDADRKKYLLTDLFEISTHLQLTPPPSTCYPRKSLWDGKEWLSPEKAFDDLLSWIDQNV